MRKKTSTVVVALSGGVDSSLAAALLKDAGWDVLGLHLLLPAPPAKKKKRRVIVERVAAHLDIPVSFVDAADAFEGLIMKPFAAAYLSGLTPNPCVLCNQIIKFEHLLQVADQKGIEYIATGHYAIVKNEEGSSVELWRGKDRHKEQSYFLHRVSRSQFARAVFPLGEMTKAETRQKAAEKALPCTSEPESQEICFLDADDYRSFIEKQKRRPGMFKGAIVNQEGDYLGEHAGSHRFTVGQRHGLGLASSRPYYVIKVIPENNQVVVARKEDLYSSEVEAESFQWFDGEPPKEGIRVLAQIRYRHIPASGRLEVSSQQEVRLEFEEPQWAITPGQALVCYQGDRVLGGGWIKRSS